MGIYTVRYAHLAHKPQWNEGDKIKKGDIIGKMGSTGQSSAPHLHTDCVEGFIKKSYTLYDIETGKYTPAPRQMNYFIDSQLFKNPVVITTYYADPEYQQTMKKLHLGYDVVPQNRKEKDAPLLIYWNRSMTGEVLRIDYDPAGYGHYIYIGFET